MRCLNFTHCFAHPPSPGGRGGFTLTEVIVSSFLITVIFAALTAFLSFARRGNSMTENRASSIHIARQAMETLHSKLYNDPLLSIGNNKRPLPGYPDNRGYYNVSYADPVKKNVKDITVVIEWVEPWGMQRSVSLTTSHTESLHY